MELELKQQQMQGFEPIRDMVLPAEETLEYIVPDYCPDIGRILCCSGTVFLRSKDCREGQVELGGTVRATVLYLPENSALVRSLEVAVPFACRGGEKGPEAMILLLARAQLQEAEARLLNPRKLLLRVSVLGRAQLYQRQSLCYALQAEAEEESELQQRRQWALSDEITSVREKDFSFTDELRLPAGREEIEELLQCDSYLELAESKNLGNKLLLKATVISQLLYRSREGQLCSWRSELPLTQSVELEQLQEESRVTVTLQQLGCEYQLPEGESRAVSLNLYLRCQLLLVESRELSFLADAYSTRYETRLRWQPLPLLQFRCHPPLRQSLRERLESGSGAATVLSARGFCEAVRCTREGEQLTMHSTLALSVLYLDENGSPLVASRRLELSQSAPIAADSRCSAEARCGEISCTAGSEGLELRCTVEFLLQELSQQQAKAVSGLQLGEAMDFSARPSIVLRSPREGESLWDIAKGCSSTEEEIRRANGLEGEEPPQQGRLLLIPRCRR